MKQQQRSSVQTLMPDFFCTILNKWGDIFVRTYIKLDTNTKKPLFQYDDFTCTTYDKKTGNDMPWEGVAWFIDPAFPEYACYSLEYTCYDAKMVVRNTLETLRELHLTEMSAKFYM